jgi:hypothetical protein
VARGIAGGHGRRRARGAPLPLDLFGVLAQQGRAPAHLPWGLGELPLATRIGEPTRPGVIDLNEGRPRLKVFVHEQVLHLVHRRARDTARLHGVVGFQHRAPGQLPLDERQQRVVVLGADQAVFKQGRCRPLRVAEEVQEALPLVLGDADEEHKAIGQLHDPPRAEDAQAQARGHPPRIHVVHQPVFELAGDNGLDGDIDLLADAGAVPGEQRAQRGDSGVQPGLIVRLLTEGLQRRQVRVGERAGAHGQPAAGRHLDQLPHRRHLTAAVQPERRDRRHHQAGIGILELVIEQTTAGQRFGRIARDQHVGRGGQATQFGTAALALQVEHHAAFGLVQEQVQPARLRVGAAAGKRATVAVAVSLRRFHLHHIRTQVTEHRRREGGRHEVPALQHAQPI